MNKFAVPFSIIQGTLFYLCDFALSDIRGDNNNDRKADIPTVLSFINSKLQSVSWNPRNRPESTPKTVIFITKSNADGVLNTRRVNDILTAIKEKATVLAVGIGDDIKREELETIASDPHNVLTVSDADKLHGIVDKIKQSVSLSTGM